MEVLPSGTFPIVAVGEEGSRSSQLTIVWPEMAYITSSCNPLSGISCTAMPNFKGKEKQMPRRKCVRKSFLGRRWGAHGLWPGPDLTGWSVEFPRKSNGAVGAHSIPCVTLGVWGSQCRSWWRGRERMGWDVLNMGIGGGSENGGINPEELQLRPFLSEKVWFLGISGLSGEAWGWPGLPWF